jgi:protein disulfide-isomerase A1
MKNLRTAAALGLSLLAGLAVADSDVHQLGKDTFDDFIKDHSLVLAEFFAPWCGHCKALAPEYEEAATTLKDKNIQLVKVDCTEEQDLCQSYGVEGYPTVKVFRGLDEIKPYTGQRKKDAIVSYMIKQSLPAVSVLDKNSIEEFKTADKVVLISYFAADDKSSNETFSAVAESLRDNYLFGASSDAALAKAEGVTVPGIALYKSFDEGKDIYDGKFDKDDITTFIKTASVPLVGEVGPETYSGYMSAGIPLAYIFAETKEEREEYAKELKDVATKYKGKINFATIDAKAFGPHAANLNLKPDVFPAFAIQETVKNQKFPFDQDKKIVATDIESFVDDVLTGTIKPSVKSEPVPETQEGPVYTIVANNYEEIVIDNDKDVLVEFYAPWCGHCKALAPKYEELAAFYFNNPEYKDKVYIAKVDATNNDVPDEIQGFPTIKLFPAGAKDKPIDYSGSRTIEDLANFVRENGKYKIDAYVPAAESAASEMPEMAKAATEKASEAAETVKEEVKSKVADATEAVKTAVTGGEEEPAEVHDEL